MIRLALVVAIAALIMGPMAGIAAESKKPKEVVAVGSKKKAKPAKVDALTIKQKANESGVRSYNVQQAWPAK